MRRLILIVVFASLGLLVSCGGRSSKTSKDQDAHVDVYKPNPDTNQPDTNNPLDANQDLSGPDLNQQDMAPVDTDQPDLAEPDLLDDQQEPEDIEPPDAVVKFDIKLPDAVPGTAPQIEQIGNNKAYLFKGLVVLSDSTFQGQVLVEQKDIGGTDYGVITCVAADCTGEAAASNATVVQTNGMIFPGMIDAHNHILFNLFDNDDWVPATLSQKHSDWKADPNYKKMKKAMDAMLLSTDKGGYNIDCSINKYAEVKGLISGTTSILGQPIGASRTCYGSVARSIDGSHNGLPDSQRDPPCTDGPSNDHIRTSISISSVDNDCYTKDPNNPDGPEIFDGKCYPTYFETCAAWSLVVHVSEGVPGNGSMLTEWNNVAKKGVDRSELTIIHGTSLTKANFEEMATKGMKLVWSPRSNFSLYGVATRINLVMEMERETGKRLTMGVGPDWSMGGSVNLLDELNFIYYLMENDDAYTANNGLNKIPLKRIVKMATIDGAKALEVDHQLGSLEVGKLADLFILSGDPTKPYLSLVNGRLNNVRLVMVSGKILYGDKNLESVKWSDQTNCDTVDVCGRDRFLCIWEPSNTASDELDKTHAEIKKIINDALADYDSKTGPDEPKYFPVAPMYDPSKCD